MGLEILSLYRRQSLQNDMLTTTNVLSSIDKRRATVKIGIFFFIFIVYLCFGSAVFGAIEAPQENIFAEQLNNYLTEFKANKLCIKTNELQELIDRVVQASDRGVRIGKNVSILTNNWSFGQSFFFSGTLLTTVGYGHVSPSTQFGKAFTVFYCLLGIPVFLLLLHIVVEQLKYPSNRLMNFMSSRFVHRYKPDTIQWLHLTVIFSILLLTMFILPSLIFMSIENDWSFLDAFYYCFISLTTIGLGDYIPGDKLDQSHRNVYKILTTGYLIFGIFCMMVFLSVIYEMPIMNVGHLFPVVGERSHFADKSTPTSYLRQIDEDTPSPSQANVGFPS